MYHRDLLEKLIILDISQEVTTLYCTMNLNFAPLDTKRTASNFLIRERNFAAIFDIKFDGQNGGYKCVTDLPVVFSFLINRHVEIDRCVQYLARE